MTERLSPTTPETTATPERHLLDGLDFYKLTMGQLAMEKFADTVVTFTMKNRGGDNLLTRYVDPAELTARFSGIAQRGFTAEEITFLAGIKKDPKDIQSKPRFDAPYLQYLHNLKLTDVKIDVNETTGDLDIATTGPWANASLWETVVMSEVNELYYQNLLAETGVSVEEAWAEGDARLDAKIATLAARPDIKFSDFGTRRRFSAQWHDHVVGRLASELPDNFIGTSNPWLAHKHNLTPIGTYAHEMPMVYSALAEQAGRNPLSGHADMMRDWYDRYDEDLSIALTDTFTSEFFFSDFTPEQAEAWRGLRHDSGDPIAFGEQAIDFYENLGIDPTTKTLVFSDGLDIDTIITLASHFDSRVKLMFGWGTSLMNDLGFRANNIVMKATQANGIDTVKLSDNTGKHTGPTSQVEKYQKLVDARLHVDAAYETMATV